MNNSVSGFNKKRKKLSTKYLFQFNSLIQKKNKASSKHPTLKTNKSIKSQDINDLIDNNNRNINNIFSNYQKQPYTYLVQYARIKIKKEFFSPYITRLLNNQNFSYIKEEEMPIYFCLYKMNEIFLHKKSRFSTNFYECDIYYNENEYLIKYFRKFEYSVAMKYLLGYVYDKDIYNHFSKNEYRLRTKLVLKRFKFFVNNNYKIDINDEIDQAIPETKNKINSNSDSNEDNDDYNDYLFQRHLPPYILKRKNLIFLSEYEELKDKIEDNLFRKKPNYFFIKDMPNEKIPNATPNYYSQGYEMSKLINHYIYKNKFVSYANRENKELEVNKNKQNININEDNLENTNTKKKKKKKDDEENSSDITENHSQKFLDEIYGNTVSDEDDINNKVTAKKMNKRVSIILTKDNQVKEINIEDNDIVDVEELIKNMKNKKESKIIEKQLNISSNNHKKKHKKKTIIKKKNIGYKIINTDSFQLYKLYDENANYIQRTFSKKLCHYFFTNKYIPKLFLDMNNYSNSINKNQYLDFNNKYFLTSTALHKNKNQNNTLVRKNTSKLVSNIALKKAEYSINKKKARNYFSTKEVNKTLLSLDLLNHNKNNNNDYNNYNNYFNTNYYQNKNIVYENLFKSKGKIIKQRKISFSIFHKCNKITFKETSEFISGIKNTYKNKKQQKELIKEIITNFGVVTQKRNKSNKYGIISNTNFPELNQYKTNINNSSNKKYRFNQSGYSSKISRISNQKEIFRDSINLNGLFNHKKIYI